MLFHLPYLQTVEENSKEQEETLHGTKENEVSLLQRLDLLKKLISVNAIRTMSLSDRDLGKKVYKEPFINPVYNTMFLGFSMYSVPDLEQKFLYCLVVRKGH